MRPMPAPSDRARHASRGFTLIELMIAVALSSLVGVLIYTVFINQTRAYRAQADMGSMQQNLRVAMEMLTRDVAVAGWGAGWDGASWGVGGQGAAFAQYGGAESNPLYSLWVKQDFPGGSGHDAIEILFADPNRANWAWAMGTPIDCGATSIAFHADYASQAGLYDPSNAAAHMICYTPLLRGKPGSFIWEVSGPGTGGQVPVTTNNQGDFAAECTETLPQRMICAPARYVAYYIDDDGNDGVGIGNEALPVLYYVPDVFAAMANTGQYPDPNDIPIAMGIEDLQAEICMGGSGVDCQLSTSWSAGFDMQQTATSWANLTSIRLHVSARTVRPDAERANVSAPVDTDPDDGFSPSGLGNPDGYHRRLATTEVMIRNATGTWQAMNAGW